MRLILDIGDDAYFRACALAALDQIGTAKDWKVGYGWCVVIHGIDFWVKRTKTGYSVKQNQMRRVL